MDKDKIERENKMIEELERILFSIKLGKDRINPEECFAREGARKIFLEGYRKQNVCDNKNIFEEAWKRVQEYFENNKEANSRYWEAWEILNKMYGIFKIVEGEELIMPSRHKKNLMLKFM